MSTTQIPDSVRTIDLWVDFETHSWMDTVAIRPMTNRGADLVAGLAANGDDLHEAFAGSTSEEMRCSLRDFDEHFYEMLIDMGYGLNVRRASKS